MSEDTNIYVFGLHWKATTEENLKVLFEKYGEVSSVKIVRNFKGGSRGYGFVKMPNIDEANKAIIELHDSDFNGRKLVVKLAIQKEHTTESILLTTEETPH